MFIIDYHNFYLNYHVVVILTNSLSALSQDGLTLKPYKVPHI